MSVRLTVCRTCRRLEPAPGGDGELLLALLVERAARAATPIVVRGWECLWACSQSCALLVQAEGKTGYLAGDFAPDEAAAEAIVDWCIALAASHGGDVPFGALPESMKGHFIARLPEATD